MGMNPAANGNQSSNFERIKADLKELKDKAARNLESCAEQSQRARNFGESIRHSEGVKGSNLASPKDEVPFAKTRALAAASQNVRSGHTGVFNLINLPLPENLDRAKRQINILHRDFKTSNLEREDLVSLNKLLESSEIKLSEGTALDKDEVRKIFFAHAKAVMFEEAKAEDYVAAEIFLLLKHGHEVLNDFLEEIYPKLGKLEDIKVFLLEKKRDYNADAAYFEEWLTANLITILGKFN